MRQPDIGVTPDRIEPPADQALHDAIIEGPKQRQPGTIAYSREKLVLVTAEQIDIPGDSTVETGIEMFTERYVTCEKNGQLDRWVCRNSAQQGRLILDRVGDKIGKTYRFLGQGLISQFLRKKFMQAPITWSVGIDVIPVSISTSPDHRNPG